MINQNFAKRTCGLRRALMLGDAAGGLQATLVASQSGPTFVLGEPGRAQVELSVRDGRPAIRMRDATGKRIWTAP